jgi:hypothetical protein
VQCRRVALGKGAKSQKIGLKNQAPTLVPAAYWVAFKIAERM